MIFLSDCICNCPDEGTDKMATKLAGELKELEVPVAAIHCGGAEYERFQINKLLLNLPFLRWLRQKGQPIVYLPKSANSLATALRCMVLRCTGQPVCLFLTENKAMGGFTRWLYRKERLRYIVLSKTAAADVSKQLHSEVLLFQTGVDCTQFCKADSKQKRQLREKYGLPLDRPIILHVGHMKEGRNLRKLIQLTEVGCVLLVTSTSTKADDSLKQMLDPLPDVIVIDTFQPQIEELYQCADLYAFPVTEAGNCIELPLSVLEAAAADLPILATPYGALKDWSPDPAFRFWNIDDPVQTKAAAQQLLSCGGGTRSRALPFDFRASVKQLMQWTQAFTPNSEEGTHTV